MSTRRAVIIFAALLGIAVGCEPPKSKHPLSDPATARADPRLVGTWAGRMSGDEEVTLSLMPREGATVDLVLVGDDGKKGAVVIAFEAFPTTIAGKTYLNLRNKTFIGDYGSKFTLGEDWIFVRADFGKDGLLTLSVMQDELVKAAVEAKKLEGTLTGGDLKLTDSSEKLAAFVAAADPAKLFERSGSFRRAKLDYPPKGPAKH